MSGAVLDASAVLALLHRERGWQVVLKHLPQARLSVVNLCEVMGKLEEAGVPATEAESIVASLPIALEHFTEQDAKAAARLRVPTRHRGLSLGDRACLALAARERAVAVTADRQWADLDLGISVLIIRE